ncbi:unnamed protein product [Adineta ricciae]|uniref:RanBD1 domain-containing protein n=1 Tax=Adineta ricciae TaxID=249248 RepID=A0A815M4Y2_ADIRI|nr:unnamed protein product [Adineta ricciae]CAF1419202.1 unnamed protein product [Adineta ricciae]
MSDNVETTLSTVDKSEKDIKPDDPSSTVNGDVLPSVTPVRLFGEFKQNGFGFNNLSSSSVFGQTASKDKADDNSTPTTYFTSTLAKISSTITSGFGSSSTPLAASLATLGANKPLFGVSSATTPSSFTDLKATSSISLQTKTNSDEKDENKDDEDDNKTTLLETVAEYEAKRASTHPATTIQGDTSTGEENEITKFQMAGKLFMYSAEQQQFVERGYGILKINESHDSADWDRSQSRLIMRLDKSFRVILNSPIFPKMTVERATDRSVRFGAQDESQLRVFIIKASSNDCNNFCRELQSRIEILDQQQQQTPTSNTDTPTKSSNTSTSSDVVALDDTSPKQNSSISNRKRSHSKSDSDASESTNDISKKSKLVEGYREINKDVNQSTSGDDSFESGKANE